MNVVIVDVIIARLAFHLVGNVFHQVTFRIMSSVSEPWLCCSNEVRIPNVMNGHRFLTPCYSFLEFLNVLCIVYCIALLYLVLHTKK